MALRRTRTAPQTTRTRKARAAASSAAAARRRSRSTRRRGQSRGRRSSSVSRRTASASRSRTALTTTACTSAAATSATCRSHLLRFSCTCCPASCSRLSTPPSLRRPTRLLEACRRHRHVQGAVGVQSLAFRLLGYMPCVAGVFYDRGAAHAPGESSLQRHSIRVAVGCIRPAAGRRDDGRPHDLTQCCGLRVKRPELHRPVLGRHGRPAGAFLGE